MVRQSASLNGWLVDLHNWGSGFLTATRKLDDANPRGAHPPNRVKRRTVFTTRATAHRAGLRFPKKLP